MRNELDCAVRSAPDHDTDVVAAVAENHDQAYHNLLAAAQQLIERIHDREDQLRKLLTLTENINRGLSLEETLEFIYQELRDLVPFNRLGLALIDAKTNRVVSRCAIPIAASAWASVTGPRWPARPSTKSSALATRAFSTTCRPIWRRSPNRSQPNSSSVRACVLP